MIENNPTQRIMEKRIPQPLKASLCAVLLIYAGTGKAAGPPLNPRSNDVVVLTGWLHVEDLTVEEVLVEVEVNGTTQIAPVSNTGRFSITLPADAEALLRFEKEGHLSKEVKVDTRHAQDGEVGQHTRHVKFAVIMELECRMGGLTYAGPVGSLGFDDGGGCLAVAHDRQLVPAKRAAVMVF